MNEQIRILALMGNSKETWGLVLIETIACGCSVIIPHGVGFESGMAGHFGERVLLPAGNDEALAEGRLEITVLPQDARSTNSDHCHFSLKATADAIATVLQYCLRASRAGRLRSEQAVL
jgi:hypothetical protein